LIATLGESGFLAFVFIRLIRWPISELSFASIRVIRGRMASLDRGLCAIVVLRPAFDVEPIVDRLQDLLDLAEQRLVDRFRRPFRPLGDAIRIR
jgi:hypothetical protein